MNLHRSTGRLSGLLAVLAIAVLVVTLIVFTGRFGIFSGEVSSCESSGGGICVDKGQCKTSDWQGRVIDFKCKEAAKECCQNACTLAGGACESGKCRNEEEAMFASCGESGQCCKKSRFKED